MTGVTRTLFGGSKTQSQTRPQIIPRLPAVSPRISTGLGSTLGADLRFGARPGENGKGGPFGLTGVDINTSLAPQIGELREESLAGTRGLIGDVRGDIEALRALENPFTRARVQPFIEAQERARRDATRRGVSGPLSALATNPFTQQIADQGAFAAFETQQAIRQGQETVRGLLSDVSGQGEALLRQEMALLGLGQDEIEQIIQSQLEQPTFARQDSDSETQQGVASSIGQIAGGLGLAAIGFCWVAREAFGQDNPKWREFRQWMLFESPSWFRNLYLKRGEKFAAWIRNKPRIKRLVRWGMERVLNYG